MSVFICCNVQAAVIATEHMDDVSCSEAKQLFEADIQYTEEEMKAQFQGFRLDFGHAKLFGDSA